MDALDREIIALIAKRVGYVRAAARFKPSADAVVDHARMKAVLSTRREWAEEAGLDGATIESVYHNIVTYCVSEEGRYWAELQG
jgi:isochorismate pyruvate lyase